MLSWKFVLYLAIICITSGNTSGNNTEGKSLEEDNGRKSIPEGQLHGLETHQETVDLRSSVEITSAANLPMFDIRVDLPSNCAEATAFTKRSGYYLIKFPALGNETAIVECDAHTDGGDWTVIQKRQDASVDFYLNWKEYKYGFGDIESNFFIGLDKLYALTNFEEPQELMILMETKSLRSAYAKYDSFAIGSEREQYVLKKLGKYSGSAGDSLSYHIGSKFSTKDQNNDNSFGHCAQIFSGAWWFDNCYESNLNGIYGIGGDQGIKWSSLTGEGDYLINVQMMIRRRRY